MQRMKKLVLPLMVTAGIGLAAPLAGAVPLVPPGRDTVSTQQNLSYTGQADPDDRDSNAGINRDPDRSRSDSNDPESAYDTVGDAKDTGFWVIMSLVGIGLVGWLVFKTMRRRITT